MEIQVNKEQCAFLVPQGDEARAQLVLVVRKTLGSDQRHLEGASAGHFPVGGPEIRSGGQMLGFAP